MSESLFCQIPNLAGVRPPVCFDGHPGTLPADQAEERLKPLGHSEFQIMVDSGKHSVGQVHILYLNTFDLDMVVACTEVRMELSG